MVQHERKNNTGTRQMSRKGRCIRHRDQPTQTEIEWNYWLRRTVVLFLMMNFPIGTFVI
jgi:hypothetical protein